MVTICENLVSAQVRGFSPYGPARHTPGSCSTPRWNPAAGLGSAVRPDRFVADREAVEQIGELLALAGLPRFGDRRDPLVAALPGSFEQRPPGVGDGEHQVGGGSVVATWVDLPTTSLTTVPGSTSVPADSLWETTRPSSGLPGATSV